MSFRDERFGAQVSCTNSTVKELRDEKREKLLILTK